MVKLSGLTDEPEPPSVTPNPTRKMRRTTKKLFDALTRQPPLPSNRRRKNRSEDSTRSGESTDEDHNQAPGFIFYQLGDLQYARHDHEDSDTLVKQPANMEYYGWQSTGFYLVARLTVSGHMGGVYAVYDMFP
jgi:hypothetical protein